jgi:hypothetical protein
MTSPEGAGHSFRDRGYLPVARRCRLSSAVVDCRRVFEKLQQKRASTGGATPSRLAAMMERGSVGQAFLPARADPCRQECLHHIGGWRVRLVHFRRFRR